MQRKITRFALAGKCGARGASEPAPSAAAALAASPWNASQPKPADTVLSRSRRVSIAGVTPRHS
jgi:hypothetical protein